MSNASFLPKNKKLFLILVFALSFFLLSVFSVSVSAASICSDERVPNTNRPVSCRVEPGLANALEIPADGCFPSCKRITNDCDHPIFIPLKDCFEWDSFLVNRPHCVLPPAECQYTLTVNRTGTGFGRVNFNPPNTDFTLPHSQTYNHGASVTLTARPDTGSTFTGWSGDCSGTLANCTVIMDANRMVTANYELPPSPSGTLACESSTQTSITLSYSFSNSASGQVSLFRGNTRLTTFSGTSGSGSHTNTGLSAGTSHTYRLRDGTSTASPLLASATCSTQAAPVTPDVISCGNSPNPAEINQQVRYGFCMRGVSGQTYYWKYEVCLQGDVSLGTCTSWQTCTGTIIGAGATDRCIANLCHRTFTAAGDYWARVSLYEDSTHQNMLDGCATCAIVLATRAVLNSPTGITGVNCESVCANFRGCEGICHTFGPARWECLRSPNNGFWYNHPTLGCEWTHGDCSTPMNPENRICNNIPVRYTYCICRI